MCFKKTLINYQQYNFFSIYLICLLVWSNIVLVCWKDNIIFLRVDNETIWLSAGVSQQLWSFVIFTASETILKQSLISIIVIASESWKTGFKCQLINVTFIVLQKCCSLKSLYKPVLTFLPHLPHSPPNLYRNFTMLINY